MTSLDRTDVSLLLVEDDSKYLEELIAWLNKFGYQQIEAAGDAAQANVKLEQPFDIIVADMRWHDKVAGDFAILSELKKRHITSVIIILTVNDSVADSRRAFKEGAWDYISKSLGIKAFEELNKSICEAMTYFYQRGNDQDRKWIEDNNTQLEERYGGHYIAVMNNQVIAAAETEGALSEQLRKKKYPRVMPIIKKIEAQKSPSISELIKAGQSERVEIKSTLGWDIRQKRVNKKLRFAILETIVAFMNSAGGYLVIGVAENGVILGLENDLSGQTPPELKESLENLINTRISAAFSELINVRVEMIEEQYVCAVDVEKALGPVFMNGLGGIEFYIRSGQETIQIFDPKKIANYIQEHWS